MRRHHGPILHSVGEARHSPTNSTPDPRLTHPIPLHPPHPPSRPQPDPQQTRHLLPPTPKPPPPRLRASLHHPLPPHRLATPDPLQHQLPRPLRLRLPLLLSTSPLNRVPARHHAIVRPPDSPPRSHPPGPPVLLIRLHRSTQALDLGVCMLLRLRTRHGLDGQPAERVLGSQWRLHERPSARLDLVYRSAR